MRRRRDDDDDGVSGMAEDGEVVRRPVLLLDGGRDFAWGRPGYHVTDDQQVTDQKVRDARMIARDEMIRRAESAWKRPTRAVWDGPEPDSGTPPSEMMRRHLNVDPDGDDDAQAKRDAAWEAYKDQLQNAWKTPGCDPNAAAGIEAMRRRVTNEV
jgi:hypothetical protein